MPWLFFLTHLSHKCDKGRESMPRPITLPEAAEQMGVPQQLLRVGLQQEKFPFGTAVKFRQKDKKEMTK